MLRIPEEGFVVEAVSAVDRPAERNDPSELRLGKREDVRECRSFLEERLLVVVVSSASTLVPIVAEVLEEGCADIVMMRIA